MQGHPRRGLRAAAPTAAAVSAAPNSTKRVLKGANHPTLKRQRFDLERVLSEERKAGFGLTPDLEKEAQPAAPRADDNSEESEEEHAEGKREHTYKKRSLARLGKYWRPGPAGGELELSVLEEQSVSAASMLQYRSLVEEFLEFSSKAGLTLTSSLAVDLALVQMMTEMFFLGRDLALGTKLLAGWCALFPDFGKGGRFCLPRAHRALKGWRRLAPPRSRVGVAFYVVAGIAGELLRMNCWWMAAWVLMGHGGYLRPSTNMQLRRGSLIPPRPGVSEFWGLLLHPSDLHLQSKTGGQDDSLIWDVAELLWMSRIFGKLVHGPPAEKIWPFTYPQVAAQVTKAARRIGVEFVPYQLRHSGPSWDRLRRRRTLHEIMKRGLWRNFASVQRYEKATKLMQHYNQIGHETRAWMESVAANLERHVCDGLPVPALHPAGSANRGLNGSRPVQPADVKSRGLR